MSSCSRKPPCVEPSPVIFSTITEPGRILLWRRTRPSRERFSRREWGEWWRCRKWADYITATNDEPPEHSKLQSPAADSGLDIYAKPRSTALLLAVRTSANLETRHTHLQKTAHSRADGVFVRHSTRQCWTNKFQ